MKQLKVKFWRQRSSQTCGIASILMILDALKKIHYPTARMEAKLYDIIRQDSLGTLPTAMKSFLEKNDITADIYQSALSDTQKALLESMDQQHDATENEKAAIAAVVGKDKIDAAMKMYHYFADNYLRHYDPIEKKSVDFKVTDINFDLYRKLIDEGKFLVVMTELPIMGTSVFHWILIYGYTDEGFLVADPASKKVHLKDAVLAPYVKTQVGQLFVAVDSVAN